MTVSDTMNKVGCVMASIISKYKWGSGCVSKTRTCVEDKWQNGETESMEAFGQGIGISGTCFS